MYWFDGIWHATLDKPESQKLSLHVGLSFPVLEFFFFFEVDTSVKWHSGYLRRSWNWASLTRCRCTFHLKQTSAVFPLLKHLRGITSITFNVFPFSSFAEEQSEFLRVCVSALKGSVNYLIGLAQGRKGDRLRLSVDWLSSTRGRHERLIQVGESALHHLYAW